MIIRFLFLCVRFRRRQWAALVSWLHHPEKLILAREVEERLDSPPKFVLHLQWPTIGQFRHHKTANKCHMDFVGIIRFASRIVSGITCPLILPGQRFPFKWNTETGFFVFLKRHEKEVHSLFWRTSILIHNPECSKRTVTIRINGGQTLLMATSACTNRKIRLICQFNGKQRLGKFQCKFCAQADI